MAENPDSCPPQGDANVETVARAESLIDTGDYGAAASLLEEALKSAPSDTLRRLYVVSLACLDRCDDALSQQELLQESLPADKLYRGQLKYFKKDYAGAREVIRSYIELLPDRSEGHYWMGLAYADSGYDEETKRAAAESFEKATLCERCREDAFIRLAQLQPWNKQGVRDRAGILERGLQRHADAAGLAIELASLRLNHIRDAQLAFDVLGPFLSGDKPNVIAQWLAYRAMRSLGRYPEAAAYLSAIPRDACEPAIIEYVKADLDLVAGNHERAFGILAKCKDLAPESHRPWIDFAMAEALLRWGRIGPAIDKVREAAFGFLDSIEHPLDDEPLFIEQEPQVFDFTRSRVWVCKQMAEDTSEFAQSSVDGELRAALRYVGLKAPGGDEELYCALPDIAAELSHPALSGDLSDLAFESGAFGAAVEHQVKHCRWLLAQGMGAENVSIQARFYASESEIPKDKTKCGELAEVLESLIASATGAQELIVIFLPIYRFVSSALRANGMYSELTQPAAALLRVAPEDPTLLWDCAYGHHCQKSAKDAEKHYRVLLAVTPENSSALHNLSLLVEARGDISDALELSRRAASVSPDNQNITKQLATLEAKHKKLKKDSARRENFLRTAVQRWPKLHYYQRQLACTLSLISGWEGLDDLAQLSGMEEKYLAKHLNALEEAGILLYPSKGTFQLNKDVLPLIERENSHAVVTKLIRGDDSIAFRPVFNGRQDYTVYSILIALFPNHLVFPNVALQTIFQYSRIKGLVDQSTFEFFLMSQVDFCVTSTSNYLPLIAFEVDSRFHDEEDQKERDTKKDQVFRVGGVPLLRLRAHGKPTMAALRSQIVDEVISLGKSLRKTAQKSAVLVALEREVDFEHFGSAELAEEGERWLTVSAASEASGANKGVIGRAADDGDLKGNGKRGAARRVDAVDLTRWMRERAKQPAPQESTEQVERLVREHVKG